MQSTITIQFEKDGTEYKPFDLDLVWQPLEPDVGIMSAYVEDWECSSEEDRKVYNELDEQFGKELAAFIRTKLNELEP